jgi:hypothetical protein
LAAVVVGVLFTVSDFVALLVATIHVSGEEAFAEAYAGWAALSLFTLALLQVALIGLYAPVWGTAGTLGWVGFLLAFIGTTLAFFVVLTFAFIASPMTPADPEFLQAGPPGPFILYFPLFSLGWLLLGVALLRSPVYPRPAALLLVVGAVLTLYPHPITNIVFSAAIAWLGFTLLTGRGSSSEQPPQRLSLMR